MSVVMELKHENNSEEPCPDVTMASPEVPLLGSVTSISDGPELKGQQLRSSARVFKKMKLDVPAPSVPEKTEKKEETKPDTKKCYRPLWSSDDKSLFFEALNEYGKDFENIHSYICNKFRKKGVPDHLIKTKEQVRHLYYSTWHKVSKYLKFAEGIKKIAQELYGLINYGELRKKIGSVSKKNLPKLNELVYSGSIMVRRKGKQVRVKTPMCKALRKLNRLDEKYDEIKLPNRLTVELRPKDMTSFFKVQSTAQNPRIKTSLPLQKRLSTLLEFLSKKWKSVDARIYDKALVSSNPITDDCVPPAKVIEANKTLLNPPLRLTPPRDCRIEMPSINIGEYFTEQNICLSSYEARMGIKNFNAFCFNKTANRKGARSRVDSISDKSEKSPQKNCSHTDDNDTCDNNDSEVNIEGMDDKVSSTVANNKQEVGEEVSKEVGVEADAKVDVQSEVDIQKQARINAISKGWTLMDSKSVTLGEIYLMFGSDSKLVLEYSWDQSDLQASPQSDTVSETPIKLEQSHNLDLSDSLSKLLSIAKLHYRKNVIKCPCGHVCGAKNNAQLKKAMESKIQKILTDIDKCAEEAEEKLTTDENMFENTANFVAPRVYAQSKVTSMHGAYFLRHDAAQNTPAVRITSQMDSIQRLKPKYCSGNRRKPRSKQVVVERKLPLLPNNVESGHQIVRMNIISQEESMVVSSSADNVASSGASSSNIMRESLRRSDVDLERSSHSDIFREDDNQWISSEVEDYSLSSLLGHLESPIKSASSALIADDSRLSQDVDAQLHSMLTQSSVDFSANFADLAAQVAKDSKGT